MKIKINLSSEIHEIEIPSNTSIMQAALDAGIDVPYSCQEGYCGICKAMLRSGKVKMDINDVLSKSEVEQGYILTCQAIPISDDVFVDYDIEN